MDLAQTLLELIAATSAGNNEKDRKFRARANQIISRYKKVLEPVHSKFPNSDVAQHKARLIEMNLSPEQLLWEAALYRSWAEVIEYESNSRRRLLICEKMINSLLFALVNRLLERDAMKDALDQDLTKLRQAGTTIEGKMRHYEGQLKGREVQKTMHAKNAIDARHSQPGGSREKRKKIQSIWASGKYSTRDRCAEEEYDALGMSRGVARKALHGTPNPDPWPARAQPAKASS